MPVRKIFLKKKDAIKALSKRSLKTMRERKLVEEVDTSTDVAPPMCLRPIIDPIIARMNEARANIESSNLHFKDTLNQLTDDELNFLKGEFEKRNYSEDKLFSAMNVLVPDLGNIDKYVESLKQVKNEVITTFLDSFSSQYHREMGSDISFDISTFKEDIKDTIKTRRAIRRQIEGQSEPVNEDGNTVSCVVM